jgi:PBS lyase HEAT-like repeat
VTPEERSLVMELVVAPGHHEPLPLSEFLQRFGTNDGEALGLQLLRDAVGRHDPVDVEFALVVCFRFGFTAGHLAPLISLAFADWHKSHEDVASALQLIGSPVSVDALVHLAQWVPDYLDYDDSRALAAKAIWALGAISDPAAREALELLARSEDDKFVQEGAVAQLNKG